MGNEYYLALMSVSIMKIKISKKNSVLKTIVLATRYKFNFQFRNPYDFLSHYIFSKHDEDNVKINYTHLKSNATSDSIDLSKLSIIPFDIC